MKDSQLISQKWQKISILGGLVGFSFKKALLQRIFRERFTTSDEKTAILKKMQKITPSF
jgi:hypothetical protein